MKELEEIKQLIKSSDYTEAIDRLNRLSVNNPELDCEIQRSRAFLYARQANYCFAVRAYFVIINSGSAKTKDYYLGAFWSIYDGDSQRAYDWLLLSLQKGEEENNECFKSSNLFLLAYISMELKKYDEALNYIRKFDLMLDEDDKCFVPIAGVISVKQLTSEIEKRKERSKS